MNKNKHIYFLINSLEGGGAEKVLSIMTKYLSDKYDITIFTLKQGKSTYDISSGIKIVCLAPGCYIFHNIFLFFLIPRYVWKLKKIFKQQQFFAGVSFLEISNFIHILAKKGAYISFRTHTNFFNGFFGYIYKFCIKKLYLKAGKIIVNSQENKISLQNYLSLPEDRVVVLYNPIDIKNINILKTEPIEDSLKNTIRGKKVFITHARLIPLRNFDIIIQSLKTIYEAIDQNFIYLIVGDGSEKQKLQKLVKKLGLEKHVLFLGWKKNVFKYLAIADYFLYASSIEGFPNALLEAMVIGLPIITSHFISGAKEIIFGEYINDVINEYPVYGSNGVIITLDEYKKQFVDIYVCLDRLTASHIGENNYGIKKFTIQIQHILTKHL